MGGWNAAKEAAELETNSSTGSRVHKKPDSVELPDGLVWEELSQDQRWHYKNRDWNTQRSLKRRQRHRAWVANRKAVLGCGVCGEDDPACLDFHHQSEADKQMGISTMITYGYGKERLEQEISKCTVLCGNCHKHEHSDPVVEVPWLDLTEDPNHPPEDIDVTRSLRERQLSWVHMYKAHSGCSHCGNDDAHCLEFHHVDQASKSHSVSQLIARSHPWVQTLREIRKCIVLCVNCHRKEHYEPPDGMADIGASDSASDGSESH